MDGCFWHGCPDHYVRPNSSTEFWSRKLRENVERDYRQTLKLEREGWAVLRFWEHEIFTDLERCILRIEQILAAETVADTAEPRVIEAESLDPEQRLERWTLVDLRDLDHPIVEERIRSTAKW